MTALPLEPHTEAEEAHGPGKCVSVSDANRVLAEARAGAARLAAAALAAVHPTAEAACGHLSPALYVGEGQPLAPLMCELSYGHGGAHEARNGDLPPTRWAAVRPSPDSEALARVEALADELDAWRENALRHARSCPPTSTDAAKSYARAAAYQRAINGLRTTLTAPLAGQHTTEDTREKD